MRLLERLLVAWNGCNRGYNAFYPLEFACAGEKLGEVVDSNTRPAGIAKNFLGTFKSLP